MNASRSSQEGGPEPAGDSPSPADDRHLLSATGQLTLWMRFTVALLLICFVEGVILVACGLFEWVQILPNLELYEAANLHPLSSVRQMISVGGVSTLIFGLPSVAVILSLHYATRFRRTGELPELIGFVRWLRRAILVTVILLFLYLVLVAANPFLLNSGGAA